YNTLEYAGSSEASGYSFGSCVVPLWESTTDTNSYSTGPYFEHFIATVGDFVGRDFSGREAYESWAGGDSTDTCTGLNTAAVMNSVPHFHINGDNQYQDNVGPLRGAVLDALMYGEVPCGFSEYQSMMMMCPDGTPLNFWTNEIDVEVDENDELLVTINRGGAGGSHPIF